jgi:aryl-alcohol dehydrogenase-like predicted oxidoreductase
LAYGVLSGKYSRSDLKAGDNQAELQGTRKNVAAFHGSLSEHSLTIADVVAKIATKSGHSSAQIALS